MEDFEKLGAFYLGRVQDLAAGKRTDELVLYDSKDLTTHAVIIGMTGSGKTGLGIGLIEEAAIDRIPVIAIDPKGDLGNLLLTFPELRPSDFEPWVSVQEAEAKGLTREKFAEEQASTWEKGLADWGESADRIKRLREAADFAIYTPGSTAGTPDLGAARIHRAAGGDPQRRRPFPRAVADHGEQRAGPARHRCRPDHESRAHPGVEHPPARVDGGEGPGPARA